VRGNETSGGRNDQLGVGHENYLSMY
jgi:hypothetical protein